MVGEVAQTKSLQERVGDRIREQIGDLLSEEDIKKLVETAMQDAFFKRRIETNSYGNTTVNEDPLVVKLVRELLKPAVDKAAKEWFEAHAAEIHKHIDDALAGGIVDFMRRYIDERTQKPMFAFAEQLKHALSGVPGVGYPLR